MLILKSILIISMLAVFYQDFKDRLVYWWLFPLIGLLIAIVHESEVGFGQFLIHICFTLGMITLLLGIILVYNKLRFKTFDLTHAIGLGDIFILFALALGYSPLSFITLLVFGLLFSLILHRIMIIVLRKDDNHNTTIHSGKEDYTYELSVPLAGYLGLYFVMIMLTYWFGAYPYLYQI